MENQTNHIKGDLKNVKFAEAKICEFTCDIKGEPIANFGSDTIGLTIIFPSKVTIEEAKNHGQRIAKAVNMHDELIECIKNMLTEVSPAFNFDLRKATEPFQKAQQLLKQAEQK